MYFISRTNKWYSTIARISPLQRYGVVTVIALATLVSWLYGIYYPLAKKITYYHQEIASLHASTRNLHSIQQKIDELIVLNNTLKNGKIDTSTKGTEQASHCIAHFLQDAHDARVELQDFTIHNTATNASHTIKQPVSCVLKGSIDQLFHFLQKIIHHQNPLIIKQIEMVAQDDSSYRMNVELCIITTNPSNLG